MRVDMRFASRGLCGCGLISRRTRRIRLSGRGRYLRSKSESDKHAARNIDSVFSGASFVNMAAHPNSDDLQGKRGAAVATLSLAILLLPLASMFFRYLSLGGGDTNRATRWLKHRRTNRVAQLITLMVWCALLELPPAAAMPRFLFWFAPILSSAALEGASRCVDRTILTRTWTAADIFRLACWSTVAPPIAPLMLAAG